MPESEAANSFEYAGRIKDGSHLPSGCVVQLDKLFSAQPAAATKAPRCAVIVPVLQQHDVTRNKRGRVAN